MQDYNQFPTQYSQMQPQTHSLMYQPVLPTYTNLTSQLSHIKTIQSNNPAIKIPILLRIITTPKMRNKLGIHAYVMILLKNWREIWLPGVRMYIWGYLQVLAGVQTKKYEEWERKRKADIENARNRAIARYNDHFKAEQDRLQA